MQKNALRRISSLYPRQALTLPYCFTKTENIENGVAHVHLASLFFENCKMPSIEIAAAQSIYPKY